MRLLLHSRFLYIVIAGVLIILALIFLVQTVRNGAPALVTTTVTTGTVQEIVSVSGVIEAQNTADLAFPTSGTIASITVTEGDVVNRGTVLATLSLQSILADRQDARAALHIAEADRDELLEGPTNEARTVTETNVRIAEQNLQSTKAEYNEKVENARRVLLSSDLEALPERQNNSDTPPTISGTYRCDEGTYTLELFRSSARSGYSYRMSGIESGTLTAYTESPAPLGTCGLRIQFADGVSYGNEVWNIEIPNTRSSTYATNLNTYELVLQQRENAIDAATQQLDLALHEQLLANASPREEALARANAMVLQAQARLSALDAALEDRTLRAPFDGTITDVAYTVGETAGTAPVITMVASDTFELIARIPEIDIAKITIGQRATVVFDAARTEKLPAEITFVSPLATEIDGVAYFKATLLFDNPPPWLRGGLNADVDIVVAEDTDAHRIPQRFLLEEDGAFFVLVPSGEILNQTPVVVRFEGNDGFVSVEGVSPGTTLVAP